MRDRVQSFWRLIRAATAWCAAVLRKLHLSWREIRSAIFMVATGAVVLLMIYTLVTVRQVVQEVRNTQLEGSPVLLRLEEQGKQIAFLFETVQDCLDPKGECYAQAQAAEAAQTGSVSEVSILAASCAARLVEQDLAYSEERMTAEIIACIDRQRGQENP